jgi:tetratricopeptide (TPR) repeat protein
MKQYANALKDFSSALHLNASSAPAYDGLGEAAYRLGKYQESVAYCNRALYLDPRCADALYFRGKSYEALGKTTLAQKDLERHHKSPQLPGSVERIWFAFDFGVNRRQRITGTTPIRMP